MPRKKPTTNITKDHKEQLDFIREARGRQVCLFSCFVNGEAASAICMVRQSGDDVDIMPMFVSVTPAMKITDHSGVEPGPLAPQP